MTSDFASAAVTVTGGGLLLAKNCAIMWLRKALKPTRPPARIASKMPTMMNQRVILTGRVFGLSPATRAETFDSVLAGMFDSVVRVMSCTFCGFQGHQFRRQFPVQMRSNCRFVQSNSAEDKFANLTLEVGGVCI